MEIEELLVAIGVDTSQASKINQVVVALATAATKIATEANKINDNLGDIGDQASDDLDDASRRADEVGGSLGRLKLLALGIGAVVGMATAKVLGFIDASLAGAKELAQEKGLLFDISKKELAQADEYQEAMKKTGLSIESIKTKIALNLVPQLTKATQGFNDWLGANKELITEGLTQVIQWGAKIIQMVVNSIKAVSKLVESTVGWKGAILGIITILAVLKKSMIMAFIANPITWVIAGIVGLMLLLDDLMVYLEGGDSLFGDFWGPAIEWVKSVIAWWNKFYAENKVIFDAIGEAFKKTFSAMATIVGGVFGYLFNSLKFLVGLFTGDTEMMGEAWEGLTDSMMQIWDGLMDVLSGAFDGLAIMFDVLLSVIANIWEGIKSGADSAFDWMKDKASLFVFALAEVFDDIIDFITYPFILAWENIIELFSNLVDNTKALLKRIGDIFSSVIDAIKKPFSKSFQWVKSKSKSFVSEIKDAFKPIIDFVLSPFKAGFDLVKKLYDTFTDDSTSWTEKLDIAFTAIKDFLFAPFKAGWDLVKGLFNISDADAKKFVDGVGKAFKEISELIKRPFREALDWVKAEFGWVINAVVDGLKKLTGNKGGAAENVELTPEEQIALNEKVNAVAGSINDTAGLASGGLIDAINKLAYLPDNMNAMIANARANSGGNTSSTRNDINVTVKQDIRTNDPVKAANLSTSGTDMALKRAYANSQSAINPF